MRLTRVALLTVASLLVQGCILLTLYDPMTNLKWPTQGGNTPAIAGLDCDYSTSLSGQGGWRSVSEVLNNACWICQSLAEVGGPGTQGINLRSDGAQFARTASRFNWTVGDLCPAEFEAVGLCSNTVNIPGSPCQGDVIQEIFNYPLYRGPAFPDPGMYSACFNHVRSGFARYKEFCPASAKHGFTNNERAQGPTVRHCNINRGQTSFEPFHYGIDLSGTYDNGQAIAFGPNSYDDNQSMIKLDFEQVPYKGYEVPSGGNWIWTMAFDMESIGLPTVRLDDDWEIPGNPCCGTAAQCKAFYVANDNSTPWHPFFDIGMSSANPPIGDAMSFIRLRINRDVSCEAYGNREFTGKQLVFHWVEDRAPGTLSPLCTGTLPRCQHGILEENCQWCDPGDRKDNSLWLTLPGSPLVETGSHTTWGGHHDDDIALALRDRWEGQLLYVDATRQKWGGITALPTGQWVDVKLDVRQLFENAFEEHTFNQHGCGGPASKPTGTGYTGPCNDSTKCASSCVHPITVRRADGSPHGGLNQPTCQDGGCYQMMFAELKARGLDNVSFGMNVALDGNCETSLSFKDWYVGPRCMRNKTCTGMP